MSAALIWIMIGFVLVIAEFFLTSFIVVFFGVAAIVVGVAIWLGLPADGGAAYVLFAAVALLTLFGLRGRFREWFTGDVAEGGLDEDFIGHDARVESGFDAATPARGRVAYRGASWDARSATAQLEANSYVRIVGRDGTVLHVAPADQE
jgi:membrane protein implicated in regulation of membrane protease activity